MDKRLGAIVSLLALASATPGVAQTYGPIDVDLPAGGDSYATAIGGDGAAAITAADWTLAAWIERTGTQSGTVSIGGFGDVARGPRRFLALIDGRPALITDGGTLEAPARLAATGRHAIAATMANGTARLYVDGRPVATRKLAAAAVAPRAVIGARAGGTGFAGRVIGFRLDVGAATPAAVRAAAAQAPDPATTTFQTGSPNWPVQVRQMYGQVAPQDA